MLLSGEIRWFWKTDAPSGLKEWFVSEEIHGCNPGGGIPGRKDVYLVGNDQGELSIKTRGGCGKEDDSSSPALNDVEVKGLVAVNWGVLNSGILTGPVEFWCKWPFPKLDLGNTKRVELTKTRLLRKFDTTGTYPVEIPLGADEKPFQDSVRKCLPTLGCNIELTEIIVPTGEKWFSFSFETFGDPRTIADDLRAVVTVFTGRGTFPNILSGSCLSYPRWISLNVKPS